MRTNIEIDDALMGEAMAVSQAPTKKAAVEQGLRLLVRLKRQEGFRKLFGKIHWDGDLDAMRQSRVIPWDEESAGLQRKPAKAGRSGKKRSRVAASDDYR